MTADSIRDFLTAPMRLSAGEIAETGHVEEADVSGLQTAIDQAQREEDTHQFLRSNPKLLIQHVGEGHGRLTS